MSTQGQCLWHTLFTQDIEKSKAFYTELFNWSLDTMEIDGEPPYQMFVADGRPMAGVTVAPDSQVPSMWLAYVSVPDLNDAVSHLTSAGGKILFEKQMPTIGRWVIAQDSQGAIFAPFEPVSEEGAWDPSQQRPLGYFCWHELMCQDHEKAIVEYQGLFNWQKDIVMDMGPMGTYQMYKMQGQEMPMGGMMNITPDMNMPQSCWVEYVHVSNVDETVQRAQNLGGQVAFPAMDVGGNGRIGGLLDNQGTMIAVWQPKN